MAITREQVRAASLEYLEYTLRDAAHNIAEDLVDNPDDLEAMLDAYETVAGFLKDFIVRLDDDHPLTDRRGAREHSRKKAAGEPAPLPPKAPAIRSRRPSGKKPRKLHIK